MVTLPGYVVVAAGLLVAVGLPYLLVLLSDRRALGRALARTHVEASRHSTTHSGYEAERAWDTRRRRP